MLKDNDFTSAKDGEDTVNICKSLFFKFSDRGLDPSSINKLVKDIFCLLENGGSFTVAMVNYELAKKKWPSNIVDEQIFELIIYLLEEEFDYTVTTHPVN